MKIPRDLSGRALVEMLCRKWGYRQIHQVGSDIILETSDPRHHRLSIPDHHPLRIGTLNAILRAVAQNKSTSRERLIEDL